MNLQTTPLPVSSTQQTHVAPPPVPSRASRSSYGLCCSRRENAFTRGYNVISSALGTLHGLVKQGVDAVWAPEPPAIETEDRAGRAKEDTGYERTREPQSRTAKSVPFSIASDLGSTALYALGLINAPTFCALAFASKAGILIIQIADTPLQEDTAKALIERAAERPLQTSSELKTLALIAPGPVSTALNTGGYIMDAISTYSHAKKGEIIPAAISGLGLSSALIKTTDPYVHFSPKILAGAVRVDHVRTTGGIMHAVSSATAVATLPPKSAAKAVKFLEKSGLPYIAGQAVSVFLPTSSPLHPDNFVVNGISKFAARRLQVQSCSQSGENAIVKELMDTSDARTYQADVQTKSALIDSELSAVRRNMDLSSDQLDRSNTTMIGGIEPKTAAAEAELSPHIETRFTTAKDTMQTRADTYSTLVSTEASKLGDVFDRVDEACSGDVDLSPGMESFCDTISDKKSAATAHVSEAVEPVIGNASGVADRVEDFRPGVLSAVSTDTFQADVRDVLVNYFNSVELKEMPPAVQDVVTDMKSAIELYNPSAMKSAVDINNAIADAFASAACSEGSAANTYTDSLRTQADSAEARLVAESEKETIGKAIFIGSSAVTAVTVGAAINRALETRQANRATDTNLRAAAARLKEANVTAVRTKPPSCWETSMNTLRCRRPRRVHGRVVVELRRAPEKEGYISKTLEDFMCARRCGTRPMPAGDVEGDVVTGGIELAPAGDRRVVVENPMLRRADDAKA